MSAEVRLMAGRLVEVVPGHPGCGLGLVLNRLMREADGVVALVDGGDGLDPAAVEENLLRRLLWVRCRGALEALRAADLLLRDGNLATVLVDLRLLPEKELLRLPSSVWHRLRLLAERSGARVAVLSHCAVVASAARRWLVRGRFDVECLEQPEEALWQRLSAREIERTRQQAA